MPSSSCPANPPSPSPPFCSEGRDLLLRKYQRGRKVHWSGFSSATPRRSYHFFLKNDHFFLKTTTFF